MKNFILAIIVSLLSFTLVYSQVYTPVKWDITAKKISETEVELVFKASIDEGWKLFSNKLENDLGPVPTTFMFHLTDQYEKEGGITEGPGKKKVYSDAFEMNVHWFEKEAVFTQKIKVHKEDPIIGQIEYMVCNKDKCLPPDFKQFKIDLMGLEIEEKSEMVFSADPAEASIEENH